MMRRWVGLFVLSSAAAAACGFEPVDSGASSASDAGPGNEGASTIGPSGDDPDSSWALCQSPQCDNLNGTIPLMTNFPPIYLPDGGTTTNPCGEIEDESMQIRETNCAVCHSGAGALVYDFILDDTMLTTNNVNGVSFIAPGDPAASLVYQKVSAGLDPTSPAGMPPTTVTSPRPSVSDVSVLYQWIMCLGTVSDGGVVTPPAAVNYGADGGAPPPTLDGGTPDSATSSGSDSGGSDAVAKTDSASSTDSSPPPPPPPTNLITNGNFTEATTDWAVVDGTATESIVAGDLCVAVTAANETTTIVLGWPEPAGTAGVPLSATGSYTFSYTAHTTNAVGVTMDAKVGHTVAPYLPVDFESQTDPVRTTATTFTHPFTPASGADTSAGLAFSFVSGVAQSVCFANVSLVLN